MFYDTICSISSNYKIYEKSPYGKNEWSNIYKMLENHAGSMCDIIERNLRNVKTSEKNIEWNVHIHI